MVKIYRQKLNRKSQTRYYPFLAAHLHGDRGGWGADSLKRVAQTTKRILQFTKILSCFPKKCSHKCF